MDDIFVDSSAYFAIADKRTLEGDEIVSLLSDSGASFVTTNLVLAETVSLITKRIGKHKAIEAVEKILSSRLTQMVHIDVDIQNEGWQLFKKYKDKDFDLIDAASFVVCKKRGIREILTLDRHFAQMGFKVIP